MPGHDDDDAGASDGADDKVRALGDRFEGFEPAALAIAPDGGIAIGPIGAPLALPAATPEHFVCLRGPCRYYWQRSTFFDAGNPAETWGPDGLKDPDTGKPLRAPRAIDRTCTAHPGTETELNEVNVYECSRWMPMTKDEIGDIEKRRSRYYKIHPEFRPR